MNNSLFRSNLVHCLVGANPLQQTVRGATQQTPAALCVCVDFVTEYDIQFTATNFILLLSTIYPYANDAHPPTKKVMEMEDCHSQRKDKGLLYFISVASHYIELQNGFPGAG